MDDNKEAVQDAHGGDVTPNQSPTEHDENLESEDLEVDEELGHKNGENPAEIEHSPNIIANPDGPGDSKVISEDNPSPIDSNTKESHPDSALSGVKSEEEKSREESKELENDSAPPTGDDGQVQAANNNGEEERQLISVFTDTEVQPAIETEELEERPQLNGVREIDVKNPSNSFLLDANDVSVDEAGTEEEQIAFMKELETFHRERYLEFKPPKFYQEPLNCLKLWRSVIRLGGYEQVTSLKLWRQVGESFRPPKTCTTVSWTFRGFYEKALLEYEKYKMRSGNLPFNDASLSDPVSGNQVDLNHAPSGRARRDAAARAMQGWHSQRLLGNGDIGDPIIKDKSPLTASKREKQLRNIGFLKRKGSSPVEHAVKVARVATNQLEIMVVDVGLPADWVKVNVQRTKDCYEVYALVPGLLREEVRVQSDPAGRLVISGQPEQQDNPWGVTSFKKVVSLPTRIDPHQTSAVVTLHGQLFVRVPFEQSDI